MDYTSTLDIVPKPKIKAMLPGLMLIGLYAAFGGQDVQFLGQQFTAFSIAAAGTLSFWLGLQMRGDQRRNMSGRQKRVNARFFNILLVMMLVVTLGFDNPALVKQIWSVCDLAFATFFLLLGPISLREMNGWRWRNLSKGVEIAGVLTGATFILYYFADVAILRFGNDDMWVVFHGLCRVPLMFLADWVLVLILLERGRQRG